MKYSDISEEEKKKFINKHFTLKEVEKLSKISGKDFEEEFMRLYIKYKKRLDYLEEQRDYFESME